MDTSQPKSNGSCHTLERICAGEASNVVAEIHSMCEKVTHKRPSIYKVPEHLRALNENAYTPWHVSIGPYHYKSPRYRVMEEHKLVYMKSLILRRRCRGATTYFEEVQKEEIDAYLKELEPLELEARSCYAEKVELSKEEFIKMLLIDGCFVVEFLCRKLRKLAKFDDEAVEYFEDMYGFINHVYKRLDLREDFILKSSRTAFEVRRDLTLLENQLPYFVLETLYNLTFSCKPNCPRFKSIVYCGLRTSIPNITHILREEDIEERIDVEPETTAHFVSFLKSCCGPVLVNSDGIGSPFTVHRSRHDEDDQRICIPRQQQQKKGELSEFPCLCNMKTHEIRVPCATRLHKSGVLFEKMGGETPLLQMTFDNKKGVLKMPVLILWHHTETFFRNIMVYELYNHTANYSQNVSVSDYMCFMDDLINSKEDVAILVRKGIIQNWLESDEVVADLFNSITKHILADYSSYSDICKQMNQYGRNFNLRQLKAVLQQDYFNQPWAIVYFITAVVIQTAASIIETVINISEDSSSKSPPPF